MSKAETHNGKARHKKNANKKICSYINERLDLVEQALKQNNKSEDKLKYSSGLLEGFLSGINDSFMLGPL